MQAIPNYPLSSIATRVLSAMSLAALMAASTGCAAQTQPEPPTAPPPPPIATGATPPVPPSGVAAMALPRRRSAARRRSPMPEISRPRRAPSRVFSPIRMATSTAC